MALRTRHEEDGLVRLNKFLADNGIASRRRADQLITAGEVMVDGEIATELGQRIDPVRQRVEIDGVVLKPEGEEHRYYLLNKPTGVVCTNDQREARKRAIDLIGDKKAGRLFTVGRLDEDSTGLILLTNDGELTNLVAHPRYGVPKLYKVVLRGRIEDESLDKAREGVRLAEGKALFESITMRKRGERQSVLLVGLKEGKNRQIRRVFAALGHKVIELARVRIGNLTDRGLASGQWRTLRPQEVAELLAIARGELAADPVNQRGRIERRPAPPKRGPRSGAKPDAPPRAKPARSGSGGKPGGKFGAHTGGRAGGARSGAQSGGKPDPRSGGKFGGKTGARSGGKAGGKPGGKSGAGSGARRPPQRRSGR